MGLNLASVGAGHGQQVLSDPVGEDALQGQVLGFPGRAALVLTAPASTEHAALHLIGSVVAETLPHYNTGIEAVRLCGM